jgi:hypothetical protein
VLRPRFVLPHCVFSSRVLKARPSRMVAIDASMHIYQFMMVIGKAWWILLDSS